MDVCKALLRNPEQTQLMVLWQSLPIRREFQFRGDFAPLSESVDVPLQSGIQPHFVQQRWMKQIGHRTNISRNLFDQLGVLLRTSCSIWAQFGPFSV